MDTRSNEEGSEAFFAQCSPVGASSGASVDRIEDTVSSVTARTLGLQEGARAEYKVFDRWVPEPLDVSSTDGTLLYTIGETVLTYVRTVDTSGAPVVFQTLVFKVTSRGWRAKVDRRPPISLLSMTTEGGLLEDWAVTTGLEVSCGDNGRYATFSKRFNPDWFDIVNRAEMLIGPAIFIRC